MNNDLADEVIKQMTAHEQNVDQTIWIDFPSREGSISIADALSRLTSHKPCGTAACCAGWVVALTAPLDAVVDGHELRIPGSEWTDMAEWATEKLDISHEQARALFYGASNVKEVVAGLRLLQTDPAATPFQMREAMYPDSHASSISGE